MILRPPAKPKQQKATPWLVPLTLVPDVFALQAMAKGIANEGQQKQAWAYILEVLCATDRMSFYPGAEDGRRASDFAEGKRWVGIQLRRIERMRPEMQSKENG